MIVTKYKIEENITTEPFANKRKLNDILNNAAQFPKLYSNETKTT